MCHTKDDHGNSRYGCYYRELDQDLNASFVQNQPYSGS
jgi:hypothetical protein